MFTVAGPHILHEVIDDEVIVIDFTSGTYFSLTGTAADAWAALVAGATPEQVVDVLSASYRTDGVDVAAAVGEFVESLDREKLLVKDETSTEAWIPSAPPAAEARRPFVAPKVERFNDMEDLILIDPVHDVSATEGWPHRLV